MNYLARTHAYLHGPTTCMPKPSVLKSVVRQIKAARAMSTGDLRLAAAMGLVTADVGRAIGFNDGVIYPPEEFTATAAPARMALTASPSRSLARASAAGSMHALALMVDFSDNPGRRPKSDFEHLLFDAGNPASMTSYYSRISGGKLTVTGEVTDYIRAPKRYTHYTNGQSGMGTTYPKNTPGLLFDALTEFCKTDNLRRFDQDGDGYVDGIFLIHAGGGAEAESDPDKRPHMIWSHKWVLPTPFQNQGVKVYAYSTEPEDGKVGVFAHEFGHVLGLPDLYDTSYQSRGIGDWCLMSGGSWGGGGDRPVRMSCWCLQRLGWIKPTVFTSTRAKGLSLDTLENDPKACYRLWNRGQSGREYFLIENRQQAGMDGELPGHGLALWHIDETQTGNTNPLRFLVALVQADGQRDLEFNANSGDDADLFPGSGNVKSVGTSTSHPNTNANSGAATRVALSSIAETGGKISLKAKV